jgi:hypothetical protein
MVKLTGREKKTFPHGVSTPREVGGAAIIRLSLRPLSSRG